MAEQSRAMRLWPALSAAMTRPSRQRPAVTAVTEAAEVGAVAAIRDLRVVIPGHFRRTDCQGRACGSGGGGRGATAMGVAHAALDVAGVAVPGIGDAADLLNAALYLVEGDEANAALAALAGAVPYIGIGATTAKWGRAADSAVGLGKHAGDSIPARSTAQRFTKGERDAVNAIGQKTGCHTCGTTTPGTQSGNFVPDHQPPSALITSGEPQRLYPQCIGCSREQGRQIIGIRRGR